MKKKKTMLAALIVILIFIAWFAAIIALSRADNELCGTLAVIMFLIPCAAGLYFKIREKRITKKEKQFADNADKCYSVVFLNNEQQKLAVCRAASLGAMDESTAENTDPDAALKMLEQNGYVLRLPKNIPTGELAAELEEFLIRRGYGIRLSAEDLIAHQSSTAAERRENKLNMWQYDLGAAAVVLREHGLELVELSTNAVYNGIAHYIALLSFEDYLRMSGCMIFDANGGGAK